MLYNNIVLNTEINLRQSDVFTQSLLSLRTLPGKHLQPRGKGGDGIQGGFGTNL